MSDLSLPAPIWRRLVALSYDGLLYLALVMGGLVLSIPFVSGLIAKDAHTPLHNYTVLQGYAYLVGLVFFGWFWTRGGQTLGMRVWRLQVRRLDGAALLWPIAALRFSGGAAFMVLALWGYKHWGAAALGLALVNYLPCLLSARGRACNDWIAGTEVIVLPRAAATAA